MLIIIRLLVDQSVCLSVLSDCLSVLSVCLSVCLSVFLSVCWFVYRRDYYTCSFGWSGFSDFSLEKIKKKIPKPNSRLRWPCRPDKVVFLNYLFTNVNGLLDSRISISWSSDIREQFKTRPRGNNRIF